MKDLLFFFFCPLSPVYHKVRAGYKRQSISYLFPCSGVLQMQKLRTHLSKNQRSKVFPFKPGAGRYVAMHAMPAVRDFLHANFYPSGPFTCIFSKTSPDFFLCWLWLTPVPVWACRVKQVTQLIVTDNWCRFPCWAPAEYTLAPRHVLLFFVFFFFPSLRSDIVDIIWDVVWKKEIVICGMTN